jgi:hypothetical protein
MERSLKAIADRLRERMTTRLRADIGPTDVANQIEDILSADRSRAQVRVDSQGADPAIPTSSFATTSDLSGLNPPCRSGWRCNSFN